MIWSDYWIVSLQFSSLPMCLLQVGCSSLRTNIINMSRGRENIQVLGGPFLKPKKITLPMVPSKHVLVTHVYSRINHCDSRDGITLTLIRNLLELGMGSVFPGAHGCVSKCWIPGLKWGCFGDKGEEQILGATNNILCISCVSFVLSGLSIFSICIPGIQEA